MGIIYQATNLVNGKIYIGKTIQKFKYRKADHIRSALKKDSQTYFHLAIRKYGRNSFKWEILEESNSLEELNDMEKYYIKLAKMSPTLKIYNLTEGGESNSGMKGRTHSAETKLKMSRARKKYLKENGSPLTGVPRTEDVRQKISHANRGKKRSEEYKQYLSNRMQNKDLAYLHTPEVCVKRGKSYQNNFRKHFEVRELESGKIVGTWDLKSECARDLRLHNANITKCLKGERSSTGGYVFNYINEEN